MDRFILVLGRRAAVGTNVNIPIYCPTLIYFRILHLAYLPKWRCWRIRIASVKPLITHRSHDDHTLSSHFWCVVNCKWVICIHVATSFFHDFWDTESFITYLEPSFDSHSVLLLDFQQSGVSGVFLVVLLHVLTFPHVHSYCSSAAQPLSYCWPLRGFSFFLLTVTDMKHNCNRDDNCF